MKNAFTLIELLVVVTIITVLAAIAVPNFLEAQVRSKMARVMSDQRTLSSAIQAYALENNRYMDVGNPSFSGAGLTLLPRYAQPGYAEAALPKLTTPIAYLNDATLDDPFDRGAIPPFFYGYCNLAIAEPTDLQTLGLDQGRYISTFERLSLHGFLITSLGPDSLSEFFPEQIPANEGLGRLVAHLLEPSGNTGRDLFYDPSNGTISRGDVLRTGLGQLD